MPSLRHARLRHCDAPRHLALAALRHAMPSRRHARLYHRDSPRRGASPCHGPASLCPALPWPCFALPCLSFAALRRALPLLRSPLPSPCRRYALPCLASATLGRATASLHPAPPLQRPARLSPCDPVPRLREALLGFASAAWCLALPWPCFALPWLCAAWLCRRSALPRLGLAAICPAMP